MKEPWHQAELGGQAIPQQYFSVTIRRTSTTAMCLFLSKDAVEGQKFINIAHNRKSSKENPATQAPANNCISTPPTSPDYEGLLAPLPCDKHIPTSAAPFIFAQSSTGDGSLKRKRSRSKLKGFTFRNSI